ncbi:type I 3-dehydroquinate dehydratase [Schaalia sp. lx-100]|uniref:type I 3-dehydroquinate dehydratase n=1 Tax=Schaalia sp. lx-100 TaxID=2899081 RepID=UPI001E44D9E8|nr:type I 3-dehydroquinate dehydratase [Schaalia sp. lx-100]MCD4558003.1 type I 3-dehydroquinate dehydratase [Schaalia sp. lx-100]
MVDNIITVGRDGQSARGTITFGSRTRIIIPLTAQTCDELACQIRRASKYPHDMYEWRFDFFKENTQTAYDTLISEVDSPILATYRTQYEGGEGQASHAQYHEIIRNLASRYDAVDIEIQREGSAELIHEAHQLGATVIASFHNFTATPSSSYLRDIVTRQVQSGADIVKFACYARDSHDLLTILETQIWAHDTFSRPIIGIGMGPAGALTRICGITAGSSATFATAEHASAPGQMNATQVRHVLDLLEKSV